MLRPPKRRILGMGANMNVSRNFMLCGTVFLVIGLGFGMHMGATGDRSFAPLHAHLNLLGFVLSMIFAIVYRVFPAMGETRLAGYHFWLHVVPATVLLVMLFLLFSGTIEEASMAPVAPLAEVAIMIGTLMFLWNAVRNAY